MPYFVIRAQHNKKKSVIIGEELSYYKQITDID